MAIARLDVVVQVILMARIARSDRIMLLVAPVVCAVLEEPIQAITSIMPSLFGFSQAWIWKWSLDSASRNSSKKDCYTGQYGLP
jgi:hypothetical protein